MTTKTRQAKPEDFPAVIKVILAAINKERLWTNFVPSKSSQDEGYYGEIEALLKEHLDPSNKDWVVEVVDLGGKKGPSQIVSVAIWDMSVAEGEANASKRFTVLFITLAPPPPLPLLVPHDLMRYRSARAVMHARRPLITSNESAEANPTSSQRPRPRPLSKILV
jgi:hypothetical protein